MTRKQLLNLICPNALINNCRFIGCAQCNEKINEWLDEYDKHVIEQYKADTNLKDTIREIHDNVAHEMYCKGIDDLEEPFETIIKLDNGRYLRAVECQYSYIDEEVSDDMCECRKLKDYNSLLKTSCGYVFGMGKEFKFCPYCGKKIKVVE